MSLLEVEDLRKYYPTGAGFFQSPSKMIRALDGVSFTIEEGETLGLVGESGCGKTSLARCILRLIEPNSGEVRFQGRNLLLLSPKEMRSLRRHMQMIFQDPYGSLNPRMKAAAIIEEPLIIHRMGSKKMRMERVRELMKIVGLDPAWGARYPHEFSGGQRQRIGIARALALQPQLIVADEPVSSLDVSIQAQIINLLKDLQEKFRLTFLFIAHDLSIVRHVSDRIGVMYLGKLVELTSSDGLFRKPLHPYTKLLLRCIPIPDPKARHKRNLPSGEVPGPLHPPPGCKFHPRCPIAVERCKTEEPLLREITPGHWAACHLAEMMNDES